MTTETKPKRFTLTLPANVHSELTRMADKGDMSSKDVIIKCLKLGTLAFSIDADPNKELIMREHSEQNGIIDTRIVVL